MSKWIRDLRDREKFSKWFPLFVLSWGIIGIILLIGRALFGQTPGPSLLITLFYFTSQSNTLITIIVLLFLLNFSKKSWYKYLAFIGLVNIVITGVIFHLLITPYMGNVSLINHVLHTINPLLYIAFYFIILNDYIEIKKFWVSLVYPLLYLSLVYIFIEPVLGDLLDRILPDFEGARYVYPFLDPRLYSTGVRGLLVFNLGILAPLICILSVFLIFLKIKLEKKICIKN
ncbi:MAG: hypothetical protein Q7I99_06420 [Acholeplasmataceae bacterium]|nr:hypothetical protein [Acholeplasmataceae bacterium]